MGSVVSTRPFASIPQNALTFTVTCEGQPVRDVTPILSGPQTYEYQATIAPSGRHTWETIRAACFPEVGHADADLIVHWSPCAPVRRKVAEKQLHLGRLSGQQEVTVSFERKWWEHGPSSRITAAVVLPEDRHEEGRPGTARKRGSILWEAPIRIREGRGNLYGVQLVMQDMQVEGGPGQVEWDGVGFRITINSSFRSAEGDPRPALAVLLEDMFRQASRLVADRQDSSPGGSESRIEEEAAERLEKLLNIEEGGRSIADMIASEDGGGPGDLRRWCWRKAHQMNLDQ